MNELKYNIKDIKKKVGHWYKQGVRKLAYKYRVIKFIC